MGHIRLGALPKTRNWLAVVELLNLGATVEDIAGATALAAEAELRNAATDPAFEYTVWLLTQLPLAARSDQFSERLVELGFEAGSEQSVLELLSSFSQAIAAHVGQPSNRRDLGDLARDAAVESLAGILTSGPASLFDAESETLQRDLAKLATITNFSRLARDFFARLTQKTLEYYLSRALPEQAGSNDQFGTVDKLIDFRIALEKHCREASEIVEDFAGGWYSKKRLRDDLTPESARNFGSYALKKMRDELRARRAAHG